MDKKKKTKWNLEIEMLHNLELRETALRILEDHMSDNTLKYIKCIDYLDQWIVDAMIEFHYKQIL